MTDRQIEELYLHKRTKEGAIDFATGEIVTEAPALEDEDRMMVEMARSFGMSQAKIDELRRKAEEKRDGSQ